MDKIKNNILKYRDIYIVIGSFIIAAAVYLLLFYFCLSEKVEIPISILGAGITISFSLRQYRIENDKMFKELFVMYNDKYDRKFNNCLNKIVESSKKNPEYTLDDTEKTKVIDYLNMCAEQYLWKSKGRIDSEAWKSWERGMRYYLENPSIRKYVITERTQKESYYGIFEYLKL